MALPSSGPLSIGDIAGEFGGSAPHSLSEYYGAAAGVPTSGAIRVAADFYGKSNAQYVAATGGTITTVGDYKVHTFNSSGTFTVSNAGNAAGSNTIQYLVVGGGGGAGAGGSGGGGGGAGNVYVASASVSATGYTITIGAGGGGATVNNVPGSGGSSSSAFGSTAYPGSGGGSRFGSNATNLGASTGGGVYGTSASTAGAQGFHGGSSNTYNGTFHAGGGGGGSSAVGYNGPTGSTGGPGGAGHNRTLGSTTYTICGGGAGGFYLAGTVDSTRWIDRVYNGGGCRTWTGSVNSYCHAVANRGGGGGAHAVSGGGDGDGGNGGSGLVVIRYKFQN
jgi:hypothetical protein